LFTDMDDMKMINDQYGHDLGDEALKASAAILTECCDPEDFIMRYGGDEFIIIDTGRLHNLDDRILAAADEYNRTSGMPYDLGFSVGVLRTDAQERLPLDDCIKKADSRMYKVKQKRKAGR
ncbi:MAG: GGDEF domain-containing protein, partial [Clostridia bacterium]|nr:GGDEF domain-containing protein [Clostridia bacterium]